MRNSSPLPACRLPAAATAPSNGELDDPFDAPLLGYDGAEWLVFLVEHVKRPIRVYLEDDILEALEGRDAIAWNALYTHVGDRLRDCENS